MISADTRKDEHHGIQHNIHVSMLLILPIPQAENVQKQSADRCRRSGQDLVGHLPAKGALVPRRLSSARLFLLDDQADSPLVVLRERAADLWTKPIVSDNVRRQARCLSRSSANALKVEAALQTRLRAMDWDQLLQQSTALAAVVRAMINRPCRPKPTPTLSVGNRKERTCLVQDSQGLPRIERDIPQLELFSQKLRARTQRIDNSADQIAATRLLAQEGLNAQRSGTWPEWLAMYE